MGWERPVPKWVQVSSPKHANIPKNRRAHGGVEASIRLFGARPIGTILEVLKCGGRFFSLARASI